MLKEQIIEILRDATYENPIYSAEIEKRTGAAGPQVRDVIRELRRSHHLIANSKNGYYMAQSPGEILDTIEDLEKRALSMLKTVQGLKQGIIDMIHERMLI